MLNFRNRAFIGQVVWMTGPTRRFWYMDHISTVPGLWPVGLIAIEHGELAY